MKRNILFWGAVFLTLTLVFACGKKEEPAPAKKPVTEEKVKKETKEAAQAIMAYTEQKKEEYQKQINAQLDEMQKKMAELKAKMEQAKPEVQAKLKDQMEALEKQRDATQKK